MNQTSIEENPLLQRLLAANNTPNNSDLLVESTEIETSEWIIFGFSVVSLILIGLYAVYEGLHPILKKEKFKEKTFLDYSKRYNREDYDRIMPILRAKEAALREIYGSAPVARNGKTSKTFKNDPDMQQSDDIRKSIGNKLVNMFNKSPPKT